MQEQFVRAWMKAYKQGKSAQVLADQFNITRDTAIKRASAMRRRGVKLPSLAIYQHSPSIDELNTIVDSYLKDQS